jgi:hypothetical protein
MGWKFVQRAISLTATGLFVLTLFAVIVPFAPLMPSAGLDPSWRFAMNEAVHLGLRFGTDIMFTFGPYAAIYTREYHPATDTLMLLGSSYLAASFAAGFLLLTLRAGKLWLLAWVLLLAGVVLLVDSLMFFYPVLVALYCNSLFAQPTRAEPLTTFPAKPAVWLIVLFTPFGLLALIKGSFFILCAVITGLCCALFLSEKRWQLAVICIAAPAASCLLFWVLAGQSLAAMPAYFTTLFPIVSGYTEAMSTLGSKREIAGYLFAVAVMLGVVFLCVQQSLKYRLFLTSCYALLLFLSFKAGFVRHDGHAVIAAGAVMFAALSAPFIVSTKAALFAIAAALIAWYPIDTAYIQTVGWKYRHVAHLTYTSVWAGIKTRLTQPDELPKQFEAALTKIRVENPLPTLAGTTDIYSFNQSALIASKNQWVPRPVLQSYSVYTETLARVNAEHLHSSKAADNLLVRVEPIDGRLPSLEDGLSWSAMLTRYELASMQTDLAILRKRPLALEAQALLPVGSAATYKLGERVSVPASSNALFVRLNIQPSLRGRVTSLLYKPSQLQIRVYLKNGQQKVFRLIAGMSKSGFFISPLVESTAEFGLLFSPATALESKLVYAFTVEAAGGRHIFWKNTFAVQFESQTRTQTPNQTPTQLRAPQ